LSRGLIISGRYVGVAAILKLSGSHHRRSSIKVIFIIFIGATINPWVFSFLTLPRTRSARTVSQPFADPVGRSTNDGLADLSTDAIFLGLGFNV
jgi:hypothetical protein